MKLGIFRIVLLMPFILLADDNRPAPSVALDYLSQPLPGNTAVIFAKGIVSDGHLHGRLAISPDGRDFFWTTVSAGGGLGVACIMHVARTATGWTIPEAAFSTTQGMTANPLFSPDGTRLYFNFTPDIKKSWQTRFVERTEQGWSEPKESGFMLKTSSSFTKSGRVYYTDNLAGKPWNMGTFVAEFTGSAYENPRALPASINSPFMDYTPFVAPDESYLMFCSSRPSPEENMFLHISFRNPDETWSEPRRMNEALGFAGNARFPSLSPDGKFLFFCGDDGNMYWVRREAIHRLRNGDATLASGGEEPKLVWSQQLGTAAEDFAKPIAVDAEGNCIFAGNTSGDLAGKNVGKNDIMAAKFDSSGKKLWMIQFGSSEDEAAKAIVLDSQGNAYIAGGSKGKLGNTHFGENDAFFCKLDPGGKVLWIRQFGTLGNDTASAIRLDPSGNIYVAGATQGKLGETQFKDWDIFLSKFDKSGEMLWTTQWGTDQVDIATGLAIDKVGNLYVTGTTGGSLGGANFGATDIYLSQINPQGKVMWNKQFGTTAPESAMNLLVDDETNIYIAGSTGGNLGGKQLGEGDAVLMKLSGSGELLWTRQFGTEKWDGIHGILFSPVGTRGIVVGGCQHYDQCQAFLRKFDDQGHELWKKEITPSFSICGTQVATDGKGNIYQTGGAGGPVFGSYAGTGHDIFLIKVAE
jgi:hypothetical protein